MADNVYSLIEEKGFGDGMVFIALQDDTIINATLYSGIIISFKCPRLSFEQILTALAKGAIKNITFQKAEINLDTMQADVIAESFPAAVAASALNPKRTVLSRLLRTVRIMSGLAKLDQDHGSKSFDIVSRQISALYPGFLPDSATIKKRIDRLDEAFGISTGFLADRPLPGDMYSVPQWVFTQFDAISNSLMKDVVLYFIFFGEIFKRVITTVAEKETSLGAKQGFATLSKVVYPELKDSSSALIFNGAERVGEIKINWNADKKGAVLFTKADLDKVGLKSGNKINLILMA
jgi:hypothetical protein